MFGYMFDVIVWGIVISLFSIALAFLAEGRGAHALRLVLGNKPLKQDIDVFSTIARDEGDWQLLGKLGDIDRLPGERSSLEPAGGRR